MATATVITQALPAHSLDRARNAWDAARPAVWPMCFLAFAFAPLVILRARLLMDSPRLSAFPLAVIAGGILAWKRSRGLGKLEPGSRSRSVAALRLSLAALILAAFSAVPWLGTAAAMAALLAGAHAIGGPTLLRAVLPAWGFVALAVLMPTGIEASLITRLQTLVTSCASPALDALGVIHLTEGNVIRITSRPLLVEQACSGMSSLFAAIGVALFYVLWARRKLMTAVTLVLAAACWVVLGNVARVVTVVFAANRWDVDLASGWQHELLGFMTFAAVLGLTLSTDRLLQFLGALTSIRLLWPGYFHEAHDEMGGIMPVGTLSVPTELADIRQTWLISPRMGAFSAGLGLLQAIWLWPLLATAAWGYAGFYRPQSLVATLESLNEHDLPDQLGPYLRQRFETKVRGVESSFGEFSREWHYRGDLAPAVVAVDFPFRGWHELTRCYQALGWSLQDRVVRTGNASGTSDAGARVEAVLQRLPGRYAALIFGMDNQSGRDLEGPPTPIMIDVHKHFDLLRFARRRLRAPMDAVDPSMIDVYQVQLLIVTDAPLSPAQWTEARAVFDQVRRLLKSRVASSMNQISREGRKS